MTTVSIIMPVYNGEKFLQKAIDSVVSQTFPNWELIIIDDGSTDSTPQILKNVKDRRVKIFHKENGGEASARNVGLVNAGGEFVSFLDADDLYLPNALADMTSFLEQHEEYDAVYSDGLLCDEHDVKLTLLSDHRPGLHTGRILEPVVLTASVIIAVNCTMLRRSVIVENHIQFDTQFVIGPDWDFWIQVARYAQFGYLNSTTCIYRVHLSNITRISGVARRNEDLIRGREKVMVSKWFPNLSEATRYKFFYNLLMVLATGQAERQLLYSNNTAFQCLSASSQAALERQVGIDILRQSGDLDLAKRCFEKSQHHCPSDIKTKVLVNISKLGQKPLTIIIKIWRLIHHAYVAVQSIGRSKPKKVPSGLGPVKS